MSKSLGNGHCSEDIIIKFGADILRLWVASSDYHADIRISPEILKQLSEAYRKIRNTAKYILGNLYDFDPNTDMVEMSKLTELDRLALSKLSELITRVNERMTQWTSILCIIRFTISALSTCRTSILRYH